MRTAAANMPVIEEFLSSIKSGPSNNALLEGFLIHVMEVRSDARRSAMNRLNAILLDFNPHTALESCYVFLQSVRRVSAPVEDEIEALKLTQNCFKKMGRTNHVKVIQDEINRLSNLEQEPSSLAERHEKAHDTQSNKVFLKDYPTKLSANSVDDLAMPFHKISSESFLKLKSALGNFQNIRNQQLAVRSLIKACRKVYSEMEEPIRQALRVYGRNPLLWNGEGQFRKDVRDYLLESRLFQMGKDSQTEARLLVCMELLTGWFDQRLLVSQLSFELKLEADSPAWEVLENALVSALDKPSV